MNRKGIILVFLLSVIWASKANNIVQNFFIKDVFEKNDVTLHYSGVVQVEFLCKKDFADSQENDLSLNLYLSSFYIDYIVYKNEKIDKNQLFGYTFPAELLAILTLEMQLTVGSHDLDFSTDISSYRQINYKITNANFEKFPINGFNLKKQLIQGNQIQVRILDTEDIVFPRKKDFFNEIVNSIEESDTVKTKAENEAEYTRLLTEGNLFLSENSYKQAYQSFLIAKKYASDTTFINSKINIVAGLKTNKSNSRWKPILDLMVANNGMPNGNASSNKVITSDSIPNRFLPLETSIPNYAFKNKHINTPPKVEKTTKSISANKINTNHSNIINNEGVFKGSKEKPTKNKGLITDVKKDGEEAILNTVTVVKAVSEKNPTKDIAERNIKAKIKSASTTSNFNSPFEKRGFIKYKREEQAVVDSYNRILIPFGKYEILRYRSGFATVKVKDTVALKTIECTGKNGEYTWSARIYQNPWQETVVDQNGKFVDDFTKKAEIYVVDNVTLVPYADISPLLKKVYKDPNPHAGTDFISAFKLWERENAKRPEIIARREEIKAYRTASKMEAYRGADACKAKVLQSLEEVIKYFMNLGYEIVDSNRL